MRPHLYEMAKYVQDNFEIGVEKTFKAFLKSLEH